jgi:hypothetical protein
MYLLSLLLQCVANLKLNTDSPACLVIVYIQIKIPCTHCANIYEFKNRPVLVCHKLEVIQSREVSPSNSCEILKSVIEVTF